MYLPSENIVDELEEMEHEDFDGADQTVVDNTDENNSTIQKARLPEQTGKLSEEMTDEDDRLVKSDLSENMKDSQNQNKFKVVKDFLFKMRDCGLEAKNTHGVSQITVACDYHRIQIINKLKEIFPNFFRLNERYN